MLDAASLFGWNRESMGHGAVALWAASGQAAVWFGCLVVHELSPHLGRSGPRVSVANRVSV